MFSLPPGARRNVLPATIGAGVALAVLSFSVVRAEISASSQNKVFSCTSGKACAEGKANGTNVFGLWGNSAAGTGVQGNSTATNANSGVAGVNAATSGTGYGVYGRSSNGPGIYGTSAVGNGVEGHSSASGVAAAGVVGYSTGQAPSTWSAGVAGLSTKSAGVYGESSSVALQAVSDNGAYLLQASDSSNLNYCTIDGSANLVCTGSITGNSVDLKHATSEGRHVLSYGSESTAPTLEDVGTAHLVDGAATVAIDRAFGATIDARSYHVFLTPDGDAALYVARKTPAGFLVRETHGGRSSLDFDYRIIARPLDSRGVRLAQVPAGDIMPSAPQRARPQTP